MWSVGRQDNRNDEGQKCPKVGEDLSDVVAAAAQHRKEGVAGSAFQGAPREAAVGFHVADFGLDSASAAEISDKLGRQSAPGSADQHTGLVHAVAAITTVDDSQVGPVAGQDFHLFQRRGQSMACLLYTSPSPRDRTRSRMPSSA